MCFNIQPHFKHWLFLLALIPMIHSLTSICYAPIKEILGTKTGTNDYAGSVILCDINTLLYIHILPTNVYE